MAGIGFELRKVFERRDFSSLLTGTLAGIMIVAGPWVLSIVSLSVIAVAASPFVQGTRLVSGIIVYSYASSLIFFGGFHYLYTRYLADLIYLGKKQTASAALVLFLAGAAAVSALMAAAASFFISPEVDNLHLLRLSIIVLYVSINSTWIIMLFASLLSWYTRILFVYAAGMAVSVALTNPAAAAEGLAGVIAAIAAGNLLITLGLLALCLSAYPPKRFRLAVKEGRRALAKYGKLMATGFLYYLAVWADKIIYWHVYGNRVDGTFFRLYDPYDLTVFFANLAVIPGLVVFVADTEPALYIRLKKFIHSLIKGTYNRIIHERYELFAVIRRSFTRLLSVDLLCSLVFMALALDRNLFPSFDPLVTALSLAGVFFQLTFFCLLTLLFYVEDHSFAMIASGVYALASTVFTLLLVRYAGPAWTGAGFASGGALACLVLLRRAAVLSRYLERFLLARYSE